MLRQRKYIGSLQLITTVLLFIFLINCLYLQQLGNFSKRY